jgi:hypothetical protein
MAAMFRFAQDGCYVPFCTRLPFSDLGIQQNMSEMLEMLLEAYFTKYISENKISSVE